MLISISESTEPEGGYITFYDACMARSVTPDLRLHSQMQSTAIAPLLLCRR